MDREQDVQDAMKEAAKKRNKEKARKKREEEKALKIFKATDVTFQKQINTTRQFYGLEKKKIQKTVGNFFKPPSQG